MVLDVTFLELIKELGTNVVPDGLTLGVLHDMHRKDNNARILRLLLNPVLLVRLARYVILAAIKNHQQAQNVNALEANTKHHIILSSQLSPRLNLHLASIINGRTTNDYIIAFLLPHLCLTCI